MKPIFVDTSALIALGNRRDTFHLKAIKIEQELKQKQIHFVTTNAVLLEFGNAFSRLKLRPIAIKLIETIRISKKWTCVNINDIYFQ